MHSEYISKIENKTLRFNTCINNTLKIPPQTILDPNTHKGALFSWGLLL